MCEGVVFEYLVSEIVVSKFNETSLKTGFSIKNSYLDLCGHVGNSKWLFCSQKQVLHDGIKNSDNKVCILYLRYYIYLYI